MNTWELLGLFYQLGDGLCWNEGAKLATFMSQASARQFKASAPDWRVEWRSNEIPQRPRAR